MTSSKIIQFPGAATAAGNSNSSATVKDQVDSIGAGVVSVAQMLVATFAKSRKRLSIQFTVLCLATVFFAVVDVALLYEIFSRQASDEFGLVDASKKLIILVSAFISIACFSVIGRMWASDTTGQSYKKPAAILLYVCAVAFMVVGGVSSFMGDIEQLLATSGTGWLSGTTQGDGSLWLKRALMLAIAVVCTASGLAYTLFEHAAVRKFDAIGELDERESNARAILQAHEALANEAKQAVTEAQVAQVGMAALSDPAVQADLEASAIEAGREAYREELQKQIDALPLVSMAMSRSDQLDVQRKRKELEDLIAKAP